MTAEFIHNGHAHSFEIDPAAPPAFISTTTRACPKSPVMRYNLVFDRVDTARNIAIYEVLAFQVED